MAESKFFQEHKKYDFLQFVVPDVNCIPRGKMMQGRFKEKVARRGMEVANVICFCNPDTLGPHSIYDILGTHIPNVNMRPCLETLTSWPWVGKEGRRVGNVLCDLVTHDGTPDLTSPRQLMKAQLDSLWEQHGLVLRSAFEYEFVVLKAGSLDPLGGNYTVPYDVWSCGQHLDLLADLLHVLGDMGVEVSSLMKECQPGQWEVTTEPEEGVRGGDVAFYVKNAVKGFFQARGYMATFLSNPTPAHSEMDSQLQLNHSLWTKEGDRMKSVMMDRTDPDLLSSTARHWLAGILTHSPALTALCCPTLNCYRRLFHFVTPGKIYWGVDDRNAVIRVHNAHDNVYLENRLPSGPCNPYLAIAATVAAGLDGINRQLPCPEAMEADQAGELPRTLAEAVDALEKDVQLRSLLDDRFVDCFIESKRGWDISSFDAKAFDTVEKQMEFERKMYMRSL
ncbi:glutamine synthetase-like [Babylonia areolata]|uniref:glutamine synthetase-like n=1 Tax=Babylonia areolata TaxID=304850 RepID=UPI003FD5D735